MDIKHINPFIDALLTILPQFGFKNIAKKGLGLKSRSVKSKGVMILVGIVGDIKGNIAYNLDVESAKKIVSSMMMGFTITELDDMAQSALSELTNIITANVSINFSEMGIQTNISTPTLMYGEDFEAKLNSDKVLSIELDIDGIPFELNISLETGVNFS